MRTSGSKSFSDDLRRLACAPRLVLAASSLSEGPGILRDSPNARDLYRFEAHPSKCRAGNTPPCDVPPVSTRPVREWCIAALAPYSPSRRWNNSDAQQLEMVLHANVSQPVLACSLPVPVAART